MPKQLVRFNESIHANITPEMKRHIEALAFMYQEGNVSRMVRHLILLGVTSLTSEFSDEQREKYQATLSNLERQAVAMSETLVISNPEDYGPDIIVGELSQLAVEEGSFPNDNPPEEFHEYDPHAIMPADFTPLEQGPTPEVIPDPTQQEIEYDESDESDPNPA